MSQQPGDQCNWWTQPCGYCCQTCNASQPGAIKCKSFDNIMMLPGKANANFYADTDRLEAATS